MNKLTPGQARNLLHNIQRVGACYGVTSLHGLCNDLVGKEAAGRLMIILDRLADGYETEVMLPNNDFPAVLNILHYLSIVGVSVIGHKTVTFYSIDREKLFAQIAILWNVPLAWICQLIVRQAVNKSGYRTYLGTSRWKLTREAVLRRDGHRCVRCKRRHHLQVHHITYDRLGDEQLADLETLCPDCHDLEHPDRNGSTHASSPTRKAKQRDATH